MERIWLGFGSFFALTAVAAGAFGAHLLRGQLGEDALSTFETAARYQMYHALALLAVALLVSRGAGTLVSAAGWLFVAGIVLFSGSLYLLAVSNVRALGAVTPFGGLCFLMGWALLVVSALRG